MPITLTTLFTSPQDMWDMLSAEGVDLRLDDHSLASGQIIATAADAAIGATSITVDPLPVALLRGAELVFEGSAMPDPVSVALSAAAAIGTTSISVTALETAVPSGAQARDSGVNAATGARLLVGCRKGTSEVKLWCNTRYDDSQLVLCGSVCDWATVSGARWLCKRRVQGCPKGLEEDYKDALERMKMVQGGQLALEDIGTRGEDFPTVTNVTVNPSYDTVRARVQTIISEGTTPDHPRFIDWNSAALIGY